MALTLGGLASGLDTNSIIEQLMMIERRPQVKLRLKEREVQTREAALRDVSTRLKNLKNAALGLRQAGLWDDKQTVESTDAARVGAKWISAAAAGAYQIEVSQLARAEQRTYAYTADAADTAIDISGVNVTILAGSTVEQAAAAFNATAGVKVTASAVNGELVLTSKKTGTDGSFTAVGTTVVEDATRARVALNANYTVDGAAKTSQTNVVSDAIVGLEVTLKGITQAGVPVTLNVSAPAPDKEAVKAKLKAFVDQYNSTYEFIKGKVDEKTVRDPKTEADYLKGVLSGDSMLRWTMSQLRNAAMDPVAGNPDALDELAELGISTGGTTGSGSVSSDSVGGRLTFDEAKFDAAMAKDPDSVQRLLGGVTGVDGIAQRYEGLINPLTQVGGSIDGRVTSAQGEITRIRNSLSQLDKRLERKEALLRLQFKAMEDALARSQSQGGFLAGQLSF